MVWGMTLAVLYGAPLGQGALVGLWAWGPAIILSVRWRDAQIDDTPLDAFGP
jgi:hypothetical protein